MAITAADNVTTSTGSATGHSPCSIGDLIIAWVDWSGAIGTVSDNINSGNYSTIGSSTSPDGGGHNYQFFYMICNAAGTPIITQSATNHDRLSAVRYTGFLGVPFVPSGDTVATNGNSTSYSFSSAIASHNNEFFVGGAVVSNTGSGFGWVSPFANRITGGSQFNAVGDILAADPLGISSGSTVTVGGSWTNSATFAAASIGFYDLISNPGATWLSNLSPSLVSPSGPLQFWSNPGSGIGLRPGGFPFPVSNGPNPSGAKPGYRRGQSRSVRNPSGF